MNPWDSYQSRLDAHGATMRERMVKRERSLLTRRIGGSLSYKELKIDGADRNAAVISSDILTQKRICSLPGEDFPNGAYVEFADSHWLITTVDPDNEIYTKGTMLQCNYLLKWVNSDNQVVERWCVLEDSTKYLTGETVSRYNENGMTLGDTRIAVTLPRDADTVKLGRDDRFVIDDLDSGQKLTYRITKPLKVGSVYNGRGVIAFILTEVNSEDDDNNDLMIADYYTHFPRPTDPEEIPPGTLKEPGSGKKVWL